MEKIRKAFEEHQKVKEEALKHEKNLLTTLLDEYRIIDTIKMGDFIEVTHEALVEHIVEGTKQHKVLSTMFNMIRTKRENVTYHNYRGYVLKGIMFDEMMVYRVVDKITVDK